MKILKYLLILMFVITPVVSMAAMPVITPLETIREGLRVPCRIDVDKQGNYYVLDGRANKVVKFNRYNERVSFSPQVPDIRGNGLAVYGDKVFVSTDHRIAVLTTQGRFVEYLLDVEYNVGVIDVDDRGFVYVMNHSDRNIMVYDSVGLVFKVLPLEYGTVITSIMVKGSTIYLLDALFVGTKNPRIIIMDIDSGLVTSTIESTDVMFFNGLTFDKYGYIYSADNNHQSINVMGATGNTVGAYNTTRGLTTDLVYDENTNRLLVSTHSGIKIYGLDGSVTPIAPPKNQMNVTTSISVERASTPTMIADFTPLEDLSRPDPILYPRVFCVGDPAGAYVMRGPYQYRPSHELLVNIVP